MSVKLRKPADVLAPNGGSNEEARTVPLPPLAIEAVVVSKESLISCLRVFLPQLVDVDMLETGSFLLRIGPTPSEE